MVKCVINDVKTGKSFQTEVEKNPAIGKKLGDKVEGGDFGLSGYELEIAGASDSCGFPLRKDIIATTRKKPLFIAGVGLRKNKKKDRQRKTVSPNSINELTAQLNLKVLKYGTKGLDELLGKKEEGAEGEAKPEEAKPAEKPKVEEKKEAPKAEEKPKEEKPAEEPKEEKKEAPKAEEKPKEEKPAEEPKEEKKE